MKSRALVLGTVVCLVVGVAAGHAKTTKTVKVDCARGDSINEALGAKGDELIVEISGMCHENVLIERSFVTLKGADPGSDGVVGLPPAGPDVSGLAVVKILRADSVRLENLTVQGGANHGILAGWGDPLEIVNCHVVDNARFGITSWFGSHVFCTG